MQPRQFEMLREADRVVQRRRHFRSSALINILRVDVHQRVTSGCDLVGHSVTPMRGSELKLTSTI